MTASTSVETRGSSTTIGVTGTVHRWSVSEWGAIEPWPHPDHVGADERSDGDPARLDWYVAADDRWHVPAEEPTVRQQRLDGTPVVETRIRIPDGNAVQRVWAVPDGGGTVVVEFENESPLPFAVAVAGLAVRTERPPADVPIQGIELPDDAIVLPVGHHATVRVLLPAAGVVLRGFPDVPPAASVVSGWTRVVEQASRMTLPDEAITEALVAARCDLLLEGPVDAADDPAGFLLDVAELVRCGDDAEAWLIEIVEPAERLAKQSGRAGDTVAHVRRREQTVALDAARSVAAAAGDPLASADLDRMIDDVRTGVVRRPWWRRRSDGSNQAIEDDVVPATASFAELRRGRSVGRFVHEVERRVVESVAPTGSGDGSADHELLTAALLPVGLPTAWLGSDFEVHGLPVGAASTVSFAVRWHGERPAVLWEQTGDRLRLTSPTIDPDWSTTDTKGEHLWAAPPSAERARRPLSVSTPAPAGDAMPAAPPSTTIDVDGDDISFG